MAGEVQSRPYRGARLQAMSLVRNSHVGKTRHFRIVLSLRCFLSSVWGIFEDEMSAGILGRFPEGDFLPGNVWGNIRGNCPGWVFVVSQALQVFTCRFYDFGQPG